MAAENWAQFYLQVFDYFADGFSALPRSLKMFQGVHCSHPHYISQLLCLYTFGFCSKSLGMKGEQLNRDFSEGCGSVYELFASLLGGFTQPDKQS